MALAEDSRAVGRNGVVTLEEAGAAARKLGEFTRGELAVELGIKPIAVGKFLGQLSERTIIEADQDERGLFYRATIAPLESEVFLARERSPEPDDAEAALDEPEPDAEFEEEVKRFGRVTTEEVRDWALMLERFTVYQLAKQMEVAYGTAKRYVEGLVSQGIIVDSGWKGAHEAIIYELRGEVPESRLRRERRPPVEAEVHAKWKPTMPARGLPVPTGTLPNVTTNKDVRLLVAEAAAFGWTIEPRANHAVIIPPGADRPIPIPSSPKGPGMVRAFRDQLRAAGLPPLGEPNQTVEDGPPPGRGRTVDSTSRSAKRRSATRNIAGTRRPGRKNQGRKTT